MCVTLIAGHGDSGDDIEDGRWGALLDALEAGGARAGAGFRADEGGLGRAWHEWLNSPFSAFASPRFLSWMPPA